jgi:hypothetical protein
MEKEHGIGVDNLIYKQTVKCRNCMYNSLN